MTTVAPVCLVEPPNVPEPGTDAPHPRAADPYRVLLERKFQFSEDAGFDVDPAAINPHLKPHTRDVVRWALKGGRRAIFAAFGLHKTATQLEIMRLIGAHAPCHRLIVLPLGVRQEFVREAAERFTGEYAVTLKFIRTNAEIDDVDTIYLSNYESVRDGKLDPARFGAASLDEASVLRSFGSVTYQAFLPLFAGVRYRFVATATPSPNRYKELIHYAAFLGIMDSGQALTRFFQRNSQQANDLTLYPHMVREFHLWLHAWAIFVQRPSDLGYSDDGYALPAFTVHYHELPTPAPIGAFDRDGQGTLIADASLGLPEAAAEKRRSIDARVAKLAEIVNADDDHYLVWHHLEAERHAIQAALPEAISVWGSQDLDAREARVIGFADGAFRVLSTKPEIAGSGCNFQRHCHKAVFVGIDYQFNDFYQAIHRIHRFGQARPVEIHVITTEAEREVLRALQAKWAEDTSLRERMGEIIRAYGLSTTGFERELARTIEVTRRVVRGERYEIVNNDSIEEYRAIASARFAMALTSIPFGNHYEYSASYRDLGHNTDNAAFWRQMDHLTPELLRTLMPGRIFACHVKDRIRFGNVTGDGFPTVDPFHAEAIDHYRSHGFRYCGMITVVTDVVRENNQTYRLSYSEMLEDGTKMGVGSPEYVLLFRKLQTDRSKGYADVRVTKTRDEYSLAQWQIDAASFYRSSGDRLLSADELVGYGPDTIGKLFEAYSAQAVYDFAEHVRLGEALAARNALPKTWSALQPAAPPCAAAVPDAGGAVWHDVVRMQTLNGAQTQRGLQNHICPLQFDIVDRLIHRFTQPGEEVTDPFGGLFTVPFRAVRLGRRGHAVELSATYFDDGKQYPAGAEAQATMPTLFDVERFTRPA